MTELDLENMKRRCEQATPGPWETGTHSSGWYEVRTAVTMPLPGTRGLLEVPGMVGSLQREADADFVVAARRELPRVIGELELAELRLEAIWHWAGDLPLPGAGAPRAAANPRLEECKATIRSLFDPNNARALLQR
jgi:hypothetical protein